MQGRHEAVQLTGQGQYVEFTLSQPASAINLRYSIPDSADGSGTQGAADNPFISGIEVYANQAWITQTSRGSSKSMFSGG